MTALRRLAYAALAFAYVHIVFGAIVRITGSGMGCGDHWPKCYGRWFPPFSRMDLVIEVTHRYLAFGLSVTILGLLAMAMLRRREPGVAGPGGVLRAVSLAFGLVLLAAVLGGVVVKLELTNPHVIVAHLGIAMALIGALTAAVVRAGGLGARALPDGGASAKTWRGARVAAALALVAVLFGGLTAHLPGANSACVGFPHCRETLSGGEALAVHVVHRIVAFLLLFHALGLAIGARKRGEAPLVRRLAWAAFGIILLQVLVAAVLVELRLPAVWRSLHQAVGTGVWLATLLLAIIARRGARGAYAAGTEGPELRRPVAAATAAAMLAVDPTAVAEAHAAEPWTAQPPVAEAEGATSWELENLAASGIIVVDDATVERTVVELAVAESAVVESAVAESAVAERAVAERAVAESAAAERAVAESAVAEAEPVDSGPELDVTPRNESVMLEPPVESTLDIGGGPPMVVDAALDELAPAALAEPAIEVVEVVEVVDVVDVVDAVTVHEVGDIATHAFDDIATHRAALVAEFGDDVDERAPHELDRIDDAIIETEVLEDEDALDANAAALAELERLAAAGSGTPSAESAPPATGSIAGTRRPPTLAVIIARGADF